MSWAFNAGIVEGLGAQSPMPQTARTRFAGRTVRGSHSEPPELRIGRALVIDEGVLRQLSPQEEAVVRDVSDVSQLDSLAKRGYPVCFVHHRIRGPLAFVDLGLGLLDVKLFFLQTQAGWKCMYRRHVHWGPKER